MCNKCLLEFDLTTSWPLLYYSICHHRQGPNSLTNEYIVCLEYGENVHLISMIEKLEENFAYVLSDLNDFWIGLKKTDVSSSSIRLAF